MAANASAIALGVGLAFGSEDAKRAVEKMQGR